MSISDFFVVWSGVIFAFVVFGKIMFSYNTGEYVSYPFCFFFFTGFIRALYPLPAVYCGHKLVGIED